MPNVLTRVGWVAGMPVLAEDMITFEDNIELALRVHVHGDGTVVAIDPALVLVPAGSVGNVPTLLAHLNNSNIHFSPNSNLPNIFSGRVSVPNMSGGDPTYTTDVDFPGYTLPSYKIFLGISFPGGGVVNNLPEQPCIVAEVLDSSSFRIHVRAVYNPFMTIPAFDIVWHTLGTDGSSIAQV